MVRTSQTVGFSVDPELVAEIRAVSDYFAGGNRSAFLRLAVKNYRSRMRHEQMQAFREEARHQTSGRALSEDEVRTLVAEALTHD